MPAIRLYQSEQWDERRQKELEEALDKELDACTEVQPTYRNKVKKFLTHSCIWHISDIDYESRMEYEKFLDGEVKPVSKSIYLKCFDRIKQHSLREQAKTLRGQQRQGMEYKNQILFLPYHQDQELAGLFNNLAKKVYSVWDFKRSSSETMKKQVFQILHYIIRQYENPETRSIHLRSLSIFYDFCFNEGIEDIEYLELEQIEKFLTFGQKKVAGNIETIIDICRMTLFMEAPEIHWKANVWYMERLHLEPERSNPSQSIKRLSFLNVKNKENRKMLQIYMKYCLGLTNLSISVLQAEFIIVKRFLTWLDDEAEPEVLKADPAIIKKYFRMIGEKEIEDATYNKEVMSILHFFDYLKVRGFISKIPFNYEFYLRKTVLKHNDRSMPDTTYLEILINLKYFQEDLRLMFLHLWAVGLRASEVCTLKGNAYYIQGRDAWIQIYQIKLKFYKRIPIPKALYKLMNIYIENKGIGPKEYIFKNKNGGAYNYTTFRKRMIETCAKCGIGNGEYMFRSHDYRHKIATSFYDDGVSIQGVRDYLGHSYEEMTKQYVDFMPRRIAKASEDFFDREESSLAAGIRRCKREKQN